MKSLKEVKLKKLGKKIKNNSDFILIVFIYIFE